MESLIANLKIAIVLLGWILAVYGYGMISVKLLEKFARFVKIDSDFSKITDVKFNILFKGLLGVIVLCFITQILNFFIPIDALVSKIFLAFGIALFFVYLMDSIKEWKIYSNGTIAPYVLSVLLAFLVSSFLASLSDIGATDTGGYHIGAVKWIEQGAVVFGIANIHTRFGFNNILYNLGALSEVSHIVDSPRAFIVNRIFVFYFLCFMFFGLIHYAKSKRFNDLFAFVCLVFVALGYSMLGGMYAEGVTALFGLGIIGYGMYCIESKKRSYFAFLLIFLLAFFAIFIKISAFFLLVCALFAYIQIFGFNRESIKYAFIFGSLSGIIGIFWALKGICVSGGIAYPAGFLHFSSLPYAISDEIRSNEVLIINHWAKTYGAPNSEALLNGYGWVKVWLLSIVKSKSYLPILLVGFLSLFGVLIAFYKRQIKILNPYKWLIFGLCLGIIFWFISAPDMRFGFAYFFPLFSIFLAFCVLHYTNKSFIQVKHLNYMLSSGIVIFLIASSVIVWLDSKDKLFFSLRGTTSAQKTHFYPIQSRLSNYGVLHYFPQQGGSVGDAPQPAAQRFIPNLAKGTFLGRDMYYLQKDSK